MAPRTCCEFARNNEDENPNPSEEYRSPITVRIQNRYMMLLCFPERMEFDQKFKYCPVHDERVVCSKNRDDLQIGDPVTVVRGANRDLAYIAAVCSEVAMLLENAEETKFQFYAKFPEKVGPIVPAPKMNLEEMLNENINFFEEMYWKSLPRFLERVKPH